MYIKFEDKKTEVKHKIQTNTERDAGMIQKNKNKKKYDKSD